MIICVCTGTSDRDVDAAAGRGVRDLAALGGECRGAGGSCGTCRVGLLARLQRAAPPAAEPASAIFEPVTAS